MDKEKLELLKRALIAETNLLKTQSMVLQLQHDAKVAELVGIEEQLKGLKPKKGEEEVEEK